MFKIELSKTAISFIKPPTYLMNYDQASNWVSRQPPGTQMFYNINPA